MAEAAWFDSKFSDLHPQSAHNVIFLSNASDSGV